MDCTLNRKATRKQMRIEKNLMEDPNWLRSPNTSKIEERLPFALVIRSATRELSVIAVEASTVDAIMLFLSVCTASTPFLDTSCSQHPSITRIRDWADIINPKQMNSQNNCIGQEQQTSIMARTHKRRLMAFTPITVPAGCFRIRRRSHEWYAPIKIRPRGTSV